MITHKTEVTSTRQESGETVFTVIVDKDAAPEAPIILDEVRIVDPELSLLWELGFDRTTDELCWRHYFDAVKPLSAAIDYVYLCPSSFFFFLFGKGEIHKDLF